MAILAIDLGWLAGIIEGEGCFLLEKGDSPVVRVSMTDEDTLQRCRRVAGVGRISGPYHRGFKPTWHWSVNKQADAAALMMTAYPLLGARRQEKVRECLAVWRDKPLWPGTHCKRGHPKEDGRRNCRPCNAHRARGYRAARKAAELWES